MCSNDNAAIKSTSIFVLILGGEKMALPTFVFFKLLQSLLCKEKLSIAINNIPLLIYCTNDYMFLLILSCKSNVN